MKHRILSYALLLTMIVSVVGCKQGEVDKSEISDITSKVSGSTMTTSGDEDESDILKPVETESSDGNDVTSGLTTSRKGTKATAAQLTSPQEKKFQAAKGSTIRVVSDTNIETESYKAVKEVLQSKYNIKIEKVVMSFEESQTRIPQMVAAKNPPDLAAISETVFLRYVYANVAQQIDKYIDLNDPVWKQVDVNAFKLNNKLYGIPYQMMDLTVFFNKTLFDEHNVKDPYTYYKENNWSFSTFLKAAKDMTKYDTDGVTKKISGLGGWYYEAFMLANGATGLQSDGKGGFKVAIDQPAAMAALQLVYDLAKADTLYIGITSGTADQFRTRKVAMWVERPGRALGAYKLQKRMSDKIGIAPLPKGPNANRYYIPTLNDGMFVPLNAKNPLGGMAWIYEYTIMELNRISGKDAKSLEERREKLSDEMWNIRSEYFKKSTTISTLLPGLSGWMEDGRVQMWNPIIREKKQPTEVIDSIKSLINSALRRTTG